MTTVTDTTALDAAWRMYHQGSLPLNAALSAMEEAGILLLAEARGLLDAERPPSQGYPYVRRAA